jgi:hypothetical protein
LSRNDQSFVNVTISQYHVFVTASPNILKYPEPISTVSLKCNSSYWKNFQLFNSPQWARASSLPSLRDHTQTHTKVGRTSLDEWSARRRDLYLTTHNTQKRQTIIPAAGFEPAISAGERPHTDAVDSHQDRYSVSCKDYIAVTVDKRVAITGWHGTEMVSPVDKAATACLRHGMAPFCCSGYRG